MTLKGMMVAAALGLSLLAGGASAAVPDGERTGSAAAAAGQDRAVAEEATRLAGGYGYGYGRGHAYRKGYRRGYREAVRQDRYYGGRPYYYRPGYRPHGPGYYPPRKAYRKGYRDGYYGGHYGGYYGRH